MCQYILVTFRDCGHALKFKESPCREYVLAHASDRLNPAFPLLPGQKITLYGSQSSPSGPMATEEAQGSDLYALQPSFDDFMTTEDAQGSAVYAPQASSGDTVATEGMLTPALWSGNDEVLCDEVARFLSGYCDSQGFEQDSPFPNDSRFQRPATKLHRRHVGS
ncbi:hypothetical protein BDZ91DRAFT_797414 [Kalaharituber pfeilii]|nr:hypothetical protein BDZ91DRAFT_797414 [Kalaharituber pfeilii]